MTARSRSRIAAVVGAMLAPLAIVAVATAPAQAVSKHKHEVYMYKVEKSLRLAGVSPDGFGDSNTPSLSCYGGDIALDGMWNVKHVDQYHMPTPGSDPDEDPDYPSTETLGGIYNDERDVFVEASYPSTVDPAMWHYRFDNRAFGDAQVKLFLTCIRGYVEHTNGHNHQVKVRSFNGFYNTTGKPGYPGRTQWDAYTGAGWDCTKDEFFVAPGFDLGSTTDDHRLVASYPQHLGRSWAWEFASFDPDTVLGPDNQPLGTGPIDPAGGQSIAFYGKCIERQTALNGHKHAIVMKHLPTPNWNLGFDTNGYQISVPLGDAKEFQYSCDTDYWAYSGYKAMVGWFYMTDWWQHNWFYGMEPRPKTRVWQFWNGHSVNAKVNVGVLCINSRTANPTV